MREHKKITPNQKLDIIQAYLDSGLTKIEFCRQIGITDRALRKWIADIRLNSIIPKDFLELKKELKEASFYINKTIKALQIVEISIQRQLLSEKLNPELHGLVLESIATVNDSSLKLLERLANTTGPKEGPVNIAEDFDWDLD